MALAIGKLAILVGAGLVGSVLAKEGRMPKVSDVFSGAYKVLHKLNRHDDTKSSSSKPRSDSLMAQVNNLRQELQLLASNRPITILTSTGSGSSKYGIIIIIVIFGYGYVWWKGWRLSDMMFATKQGLFDACNDVGQRVDNVYSSIGETRRDLSSRINRVDSSMDELAEVTGATKGEISELQKEIEEGVVFVQSLNHSVQILQTRLHSIAEGQDEAYTGVCQLLGFGQENLERIQTATSSPSRLALEILPETPSRTRFLPPLPSPSASNRFFTVQEPLQNAATTSGLADLIGISEPSEQLSTPEPRVAEVSSNRVSGGLVGRGIPGASFFSRTRSASRSSQ